MKGYRIILLFMFIMLLTGGTNVLADAPREVYTACTDGDFIGNTELRTVGGMYTSGLVLPRHMYIKTSKGGGTVTFNPYYTQQGMTLDKRDDGWYTSEQPEAGPVLLKDFRLKSDIVFVTAEEINSDTGLEIGLTAEFTEDSPCEELAYIPFAYSISFGGEMYQKNSDMCDGEYYEGDFNSLNMVFAPVSADVIGISRWSGNNGMYGNIAAGVYDIVITAPAVGGNISQSMRLVVTDGSTEAGDVIVSDTHGSIIVTYTNSTGHDISDGKFIAAAYKEDILQGLGISERVSIENGAHRTFSFDMSDFRYDTVKLFVWQDMESMLPLADSYYDLSV